MAETHPVTFEWPYSGANTVIVTGTFDHWSSSRKLSKEDSKFKGTVQVPWNQKVAYKFIVDGKWVVNEKEPTELDPAGNLNNVYFSPEKPVEVPAPVKQEEVVSEIPSTQESKSPEVNSQQGVLPEIIKTVSATEGTSGTLAYIASGVGAAIQSVLGVDPINPVKQVPETSITPTTKAGESQEPTPLVPVPVLVAETKQEVDEPPVINGTISSVEPSKKTAEPLPLLPLPNITDSTKPLPQSISENGPSTHVPVSSTAEPSQKEPLPVPETTATSSPPADDPVSAIPTTNSTAPSVPSTTTPEAKIAASDPGSVSHSSPLMDDTTAVSPSIPQTPLNGSKAAETVTPTPSSSASRSTSPAPSTPSKKHKRFSSVASTASPSSDKEKSPSRFKSLSGSRSIKKSLAGLRRVSIKGIFGGSKDKEDK